MSKKIGFIGSGNMGQAMINGIIKKGHIAPENIIVSDIDEKKLDSISTNCGVKVTTNSNDVVNEAEIIFLAVKPNIYNSVLNEIKNLSNSHKVFVSIAAGISIRTIEEVLGENTKVIRTMPNTPAFVGEGMSAICPNKNITKDELNEVIDIFNSFGKSEIISEDLIDTFIGVAGSSPAYVFMFIEAMADAAVANGMARDKAYKFSAQAVLGSAKMVLESGKHPGELKDMVCSPGGTTIEAVTKLEEKGFRSSVISGVQACIDKARKMG